METKKAPVLFSLAKVYCTLFGHKFRVSNVVTAHIKEYRCTSCGEEMTDTADGNLEKLTQQFRETNQYLAQFYEKRSRKILTGV